MEPLASREQGSNPRSPREEERDTAENGELQFPLRNPGEDDTSRAHSISWDTKHGRGASRPGGKLAPEGSHPATRPYLPTLSDHDVVAVPVTNPQHIRGHTVASTGEGEFLDGPIQGLPEWGRWKIMAHQPATPYQRWVCFSSS